MGMFDTVVCRYPLPHHQDAEFQTKDMAGAALGEHFIGGLLDQYEITSDGRLRRHLHERQWTEDPEAPLGGYLKSVRDWWEDVPGAHGDVVLYTTDEAEREGKSHWVEFRVRFTNGRVQDVHEVPPRPGPADEAPTEDAGPAVALHDEHPPEVDDRPEVGELLERIKAESAALRRLLQESSSHWGYEDAIYRFYHHSFKVYGLQATTREIASALEALRPGHPLHPWFRAILEQGTGKTFQPEDNLRWLEATRPILEAFFHARYFLEMAVRYGWSLEAPPRMMPSGWAALLELFDLR